MEMEIRLYEGQWYINGYVIEGEEDLGYYVYNETDEKGAMPVYDNDSFEKCLMWCLNS